MTIRPAKKVTSFFITPGTHDGLRWLAFMHGRHIGDELEATVLAALKREFETRWLEKIWQRPVPR